MKCSHCHKSFSIILVLDKPKKSIRLCIDCFNKNNNGSSLIKGHNYILSVLDNLLV